jgi:arylsulfatase A-like enzyme
MHAKEEHLEKYKDHPRQKLAAMTWSMDENIGKVVDKLKAEGLYQNTLIFFLSDNGGAYNNQSSSGPLKGWKGNKFEGGHRVPFTVTWPKQLKGGRTYEKLSSSLDIFATSMQAAGLDPKLTETDGVDLLPYLRGEKAGAPHEWLFWRKDKMAAVRKEKLKMIRLEDYGYRLYDLEQNLGETEDLTAAQPQVKTELQQALEQWEEGTEAPRWLEGPAWSPVTYEITQALMENREPNYTNPGAMRRFKEK